MCKVNINLGTSFQDPSILRPILPFLDRAIIDDKVIEKNKPHKAVVHQQPPKERIYEEAEDCRFQLHIVIQAA